MKKSNFLSIGAIALCLAFATGCDDFLDVMPDNRAEIDTEEKVVGLLASAYPTTDYCNLAELYSDNVDRYNNDYVASRFFDQVYAWEDITESNNESPERLWGACYEAISTANHALQAIENLGGAKSQKLIEARAEALLCRAYGHFILVNMFCMNYDRATSSTDLGVTYMEAPETTLDPEYSRGTVADVYQKIERDIEEALPIMGDSNYSVPKYHFNPAAAYAFAARFYLYYEKWDKCVECATKCLGSAPEKMLRNYSEIAGMTSSFEAYSNEYINARQNCNLLLLTAYSNLGQAFGPFTANKRYAHGNYLASQETAKASNVWGANSDFHTPMKSYSGTNREYNIYWRIPDLKEYTDPVAGTFYRRIVYPAFTADECLLNRAEANIILKNYDAACADMNIWVANQLKNPKTLTPQMITEFYNAVKYSYDDVDGMTSTIKKHLNPSFEIEAEGSTQECMLQCVLGMRRIECMPAGIRWFDIKRYGIEIVRRQMNASGDPEKVTDRLPKNDPRRAIQLAPKVISAGVLPNPR